MGVYEEIIRTASDVCDAVDEAIRSQNYAELSRTISRKVGGFAESAGDAIGSFGRQLYSEQGAKRKPGTGSAPVRPERYFAAPQSEVGPRIASIVGGAIAVLFGFITLIIGVLSTFVSLISPAAVVMGLMAAAGVAMALLGHRAARKRVRFKTYRKLLLPKLYADVWELADRSGYKESEVVSDLEEMSREGLIREGHFDDSRSCFIVSDELYRQYRETVDHAGSTRKAVQAEAASPKTESARLKKEAAQDPAVRELLTKGSAYIEAIHHANDLIPNEEITEKLNYMELIVRRIFEEVAKRPELAKKLNMFMTYYLPTTTKLMDAYIEMDRQQVAGENILKTKQEISASLSMICSAYERLLDDFFKDTAMDVTSDISVMKLMMKQEGLTDDDLTASKKASVHAEATPEKLKTGTEAPWETGTKAGAYAQTAGGMQLQSAPWEKTE